ncbi:hypothetical protein M426DRAFT_94378 [Hypoxylon sp. CI-4A]|nr:hypothetical protein M426DRAFT_94378 [Hypoxylon sp. CI-4A]
MATNKRRKLDVAAEPPQAMSAFALRKKLLGQQTITSTPKIDPVDETPSSPKISSVVETRKARSPKKAKKGPSVQLASNHEYESNVNLKESILDEPLDEVVASKPTDVLSRSPSPPTSDDEEEEVSVNLPKAPPAQLSNFRPSKNNCQRRKDGRTVLKLSEGDRLVILGNYGIRVTAGELTINGAILKNSDKVYWVNAPHCHALPVIRCPEAANLELLPHPHAIDLRSLGKLSPQFRKLWNEPSPSDKDTASRSTFRILYTSADGPKKVALQDLISPPEWNREVAKLAKTSGSKPCSVMVTGPKSSGKSTFGKILANRLLTEVSSSSKSRTRRGVAVLDIDPGQPEYCVAGQIALVFLTEPVFNPSFCRPLPSSGIEIIRSHALASVSPASDPELFLEAAMDLMTHYRNTLGRYPLIINTPGWIQGTGLDLLTSLITDLRPTEVIYMSETGPTEAVEALQESCKASGFSMLPSQASQLTSRTAAHFRSMQTMSYFHANTHDTTDDQRTRWNPKPLTTVPPWQVSYQGPNAGILGIMCYDYQAPLDLLADAINGTVLAIVGVESVKAFRHSTRNKDVSDDATESMMDIDEIDGTSQSSAMPSFSSLAEKTVSTTPEGIPIIDTVNGTTLDPRYSHSLGLALVRGIDVENGVLQLLTPLSVSRIEEVVSKGGEIVLISGKFDTPSWAYTEDQYYRTHGNKGGNDDGDEPMDAQDDEVDDSSDEDGSTADATPIPWIEILHGNQKRGAGSKVWRVRRDLGRT